MRRRRMYRTIGLYIVGCWIAIQVAATFFPAWGIPATSLRYVIWAAVLIFPAVVVFSWLYDVTPKGIIRTSAPGHADPSSLKLRKKDYAILSTLGLVCIAIVLGGVDRLRSPISTEVSSTGKPENSIAVLPFENLDGPDSDTVYFSDGVTEEVLHRLSSFRELQVIGRTSSFAFRDGSMTIPHISNILGVRYLLQGSVRRDAGQVRIIARLVDDAGFQVWSQTFDRQLEGVFQIQTDIANSVAQQLVTEIVSTPLNPAAATDSIDAYQHYLIGRDHVNRRSGGWTVAAREAFDRAIEADPNYAPPYAGLAIVEGVHAHLDPDNFAARLARARSFIDRALALDPNLAEAYAALGQLTMTGTPEELVASEAALRRAIELDPSFASAYNWLGTVLLNQGRYEESTQIRLAALEVDPLNPVINTNVALRYMAQGDFFRAEALHLRLMEVPDPSGLTFFALQQMNRIFGRLVESNRWAKRTAVDFYSANANVGFSELAKNYRLLGLHDDAEYWYARYAQGNPNRIGILTHRINDLRVQGEFDAMPDAISDILAEVSANSTSLPRYEQQVLGAAEILSGDIEAGIERLNDVVDPDGPIQHGSGGGADAINAQLMLAYGFRLTDQHGKAEQLIAKSQAQMQVSLDRGAGRSPLSQEYITLIQVMQGERQAAIQTLSKNVDLGWRNYLPVINDPRWGDFFDDPEVQPLMAFVKADLDRQARLAKADDAREDFRTEIAEMDRR